MSQSGQDRLYFEYSPGDFEHPIDDDVGFDPGDTRDIADPAPADPTTYDRSPVDTFSTSDYSPSILDTSASELGSSTQSTFPNIDRYASTGSFASPLFGGDDSSRVFGEFSPSAPAFYPFVGSTSSDSPGDSLGDLTLPGLVSGPAAAFPVIGAGTGGGDLIYPTQIQPQPRFSTDDPSMTMAASLSPNKRARLTLDANRTSPGRAPLPRRPGANRPLQPALPSPTIPAGPSQSVKPKLRSASSSSKNVAHRSSETPKERKERNSHNLVEKKYRNRLNAQYKELMNSLPPETQWPTHNTAAGSSGASSDQADKPLSKGEVLEKSTAYIQELERNHARLSEDNEALSRNMERLCSLFAGGGNVGDMGRPEG